MQKRVKNCSIVLRDSKNLMFKIFYFNIYAWQRRPKDYNAFKENKSKRRIEVIKSVISFVREAKRFKNDLGNQLLTTFD